MKGHLTEAVEYTLKCRSENRYFAAGTDVGTADGLKGKQKLEEVIAPPFHCRFSHSATITGEGKTALRKTPKTLREASALFPMLGTLRADGRPCAPETALEVVNSITVDESVCKGGKIVFKRNDDEKSAKATVALILWSRDKQGRLAVTELSFRIEDSEERFSRDLAEAGPVGLQGAAAPGLLTAGRDDEDGVHLPRCFARLRGGDSSFLKVETRPSVFPIQALQSPTLSVAISTRLFLCV